MNDVMNDALAGYLKRMQERREAWRCLRENAPDTTCTVYAYTCDDVAKRVGSGESRSFAPEEEECPCLNRLRYQLETGNAKKVLAQARSRFGWLEPRPDMTFETYVAHPSWRRHEAESALQAKEMCLRYALDPDAMPFLTIFGPYGSGKTHLAMAIAQEVALLVTWANSPEMLSFLRSTFNKNNRLQYDEEFERVKTSRILVIDDFSAEYHVSRANGDVSWAEEQLYQIINYRHWKRLPTVITTNEDVLKRTGRIGSRIRDHQTSGLIRLDVQDYRLMLPRRK